jgi:photosystem II stability/assembly factor-like uncharacterized protein
MTLLMGTDHGLYRADEIPFESDDTEQVLDCGRVTMMTHFEHADGVFIATEDGAYRSLDSGNSWNRLEVPKGDRYWVEGDATVWSLLVTSDGVFYAGTDEPALYRSFDEGESWHELRGFKDLDSIMHWESPDDPSSPRVRSLASVPQKPDRLIAGVEVGGVHISDDGGETWTDRREGIEDDVHHVLPLTADCWLVATGFFDLELEHVGLETGLGHATGWGGLYRTTDAGASWKRLDVGNPYSYIRRVFTYDGTVFFSGADGAPPAWPDDEQGAAVFESTNFGRTFERVSYPGESQEVVEDWIVDENGDVLCGSGLFDVPNQPVDFEGRIMRRTDEGEYETVGTVPSSVGCIEPV